MGVTREMARDLRDKYAEMLAMRLLHAHGEEDAVEVRDRMLALATRFPGALREIDRLELDEIRLRIERLDAVLQGSAEGDQWMEAVSVFHSLFRGALAVKRWLDGRRTVDASIEHAFAAARVGLPREALGWEAQLAQVAEPPRGRVMHLVVERLALQLGTTERQARELVFGRSNARPGEGG